MDTPAMLETLRDPMGVPFYPVVFQALMVLTFALHILAVNLALGALGLSLYGRFQGGADWEKLSPGLAKSATAAVSAAILLGVAPLLFVQVIYDPFWYASNLLSAAWVVGFVFVMMAAYGALYVFALSEKKGPCATTHGLLALAGFVVAGVVMHALNLQMLAPDRWLSWYSRAGGVDSSGTLLHAFSLPRFLHFMVPSAAAGGVFLMLYAWYFGPRADYDRDFLGRVGRLGASLAFWATAVQAGVGFWWLLSLPAELGFAKSPLFLLAAALGVALLIGLGRLALAEPRPERLAPHAAGGLVLVVLAMSTAREALRASELARFGYAASGHRVHLDLGSTALFLATFVLGGSVAAWLLSVAFQSGRATGTWEAGPRMRAWGRVSVGILIGWVLVVAGLGVVVTLRNRGL